MLAEHGRNTISTNDDVFVVISLHENGVVISFMSVESSLFLSDAVATQTSLSLPCLSSIGLSYRQHTHTHYITLLFIKLSRNVCLKIVTSLIEAQGSNELMIH